MQDRGDTVRTGPAPEGRLPRYHFIKDASQGEKVAAAIDRKAAYLFRGHVPDGAHHGSGLRQGWGKGSGFRCGGSLDFDAGQAKVEDLHPAIGSQE